MLVELLQPFSTDMERIKTIEQLRNQQLPAALPEPYAHLLYTLVLLQPAARPTTSQIRESLRRIIAHTDTNGTTAAELQRQMHTLQAELQKLRVVAAATDGETPPPGHDSREAEILSKNSEISRLQRHIVRNATELRSKDAEIRRLKAKLRQRISSSGEGDV